VHARLGRGLTRCDARVATLGAIPRSRVEELPSSRAGVLRRAILRQRRRGTYDARSLARARILVTPRGRRRVDRVSIASHRSMRSIDQMIDRCDRSIDRSKRQKMVSSGCGAGVCVPMIGHVACVRPTDFFCLPDPRARRARRYASTRD
jgi:hypothetical protein